MDSILGDSTYEENLQAQRNRDKQIPLVTQVGGELAGSIAATIVAAPVAGLTRAGQLFTKLPGWLRTTGLGTLWGALFSSGSAEGDFQSRLEAGAKGAAFGAVTGGVLHGAVKAGGGLVGLARSRTNPPDQAARALGDAFALDGISVDRVLARLRELGPQATIADAAGANTLGLARGVAGQPGPAKEKISQTLRARGLGESDRITKQVTKNLGPADYFAQEDVLLEKLRAGAREAYQEAYYANPVIQSAKLDRILQAPIAQAVLKEAALIAGIERAAGKVKWLGPVDEELTQLAQYAALHAGGSPVSPPGVAKGLSLETWDYVKRGLSSLLDRPSNTNELTKRLTKKGSAIKSLEKALTNALDETTGGKDSLYAFARKQYAGDAEILTALREGERFMTQRPEAITRRLAELSTAAQVAYRNGAARAVLDVVDKTKDVASIAGRLHSTRMTRGRIRAVFPNQKQYFDYARRMVAEQRFAETQNAISSGSRTAPMQKEIAEVEGMLGKAGAILGSASPFGHALVTSSVGRQTVQKWAGQLRGSGTNKVLASWLVTRNRADQLRILDKMRPFTSPTPPTPQGVRAATLATVQGEGRLFNQ
ncbi:MAG: hypothetical protein J3T61_00150 [Candidatus Brocadiales bacterium]|nr:hypothetical protein [Candidatus Bathyanammoxibius sp.]